MIKVIDKKMIGIIVAALIIATPVAVFSDGIQGALNDTIASNNSTNMSNPDNATTVQENNSTGGTPTTEETTQTETGTTESSDSGQTTTETTNSVLTDNDPTNDWKANPKIRVNPAGHYNKDSPGVQYNNESRFK